MVVRKHQGTFFSFGPHPARSRILDGEAVAFGQDGIASFERIRYKRHDDAVFLYAFDIIELTSRLSGGSELATAGTDGVEYRVARSALVGRVFGSFCDLTGLQGYARHPRNPGDTTTF